MNKQKTYNKEERRNKDHQEPERKKCSHQVCYNRTRVNNNARKNQKLKNIYKSVKTSFRDLKLNI